jgi:hypothetical protein
LVSPLDADRWAVKLREIGAGQPGVIVFNGLNGGFNLNDAVFHIGRVTKLILELGTGCPKVSTGGLKRVSAVRVNPAFTNVGVERVSVVLNVKHDVPLMR